MERRISNRRFEYLGYSLMLMLGYEVSGFQLLLGNIAAEFSLTNLGLGILASAQSAGTVISTLAFGGLTDRMSKRKAVALFACLMLIGCLLAGFSGGAVTIAASIFIKGLGFSIVEGTTPASLCETDPQKSNKYTNMCQVFFSVGAVGGPLVVQALLNLGMHWRGHFYIAAGMMLLLTVLYYTTRRHVDESLSKLKKAAGKVSLKSILCGALILLVVAMAVYVALESAGVYFIDPYFEGELHDSQNGALAISIIWAAMIPSRLLASRVHKNKGLFICGCFAVMAAACLLLALTKNAALALVGCGLFGLSAGPVFPTAMSVTMDAFPESTGRACNLLLTAAGIGGLVANVAMGAVSDAVGVGGGYLMSAALALVGIVSFAIGNKKAQKRAAKWLNIERGLAETPENV
ncbi:MAG: MFS transporter [Christensenellaceae bacterium]|nr:MFS transporter [Christensenellaceae bacterium]